tara:strand:+ start:1730 stop:2428 length:699 start_codon:yes stop_codon:yes gene_type:complete
MQVKRSSLNKILKSIILVLLIILLISLVISICKMHKIHYHLIYFYYTLSYSNYYLDLNLNEKFIITETGYIVGANGVFSFDYILTTDNIIKCIPVMIKIDENMKIKKKVAVLLHELIHYYQCRIAYKVNKLKNIKHLKSIKIAKNIEEQRFLYPVLDLNYSELLASTIYANTTPNQDQNPDQNPNKNNIDLYIHIKKNYKPRDWEIETEAYLFNNIASFTFIEFYVWFYDML